MGRLSLRVFGSNKRTGEFNKRKPKKGHLENHKEDIESKVTYNTVW